LVVWSSDRISIKAPIENKEASTIKPFSGLDPIQTTITFFNTKSDSYSTNSNKVLVGGDRQEWKNVSKIGKNCIKHLLPRMDGEEMGELIHALNNCKRTGFPIFLDPKTTSFIEIGIHAKIRQHLSDTTIIKNIRYARFMENHVCSINFRNLTPESVLRHFDYRIEFENATPHALAHQKKAIMMFLRAYGFEKDDLRIWSIVLKTPPITINDEIEFVYPRDVHKFYTYEKYSKKKHFETRTYENKLFQHIAFMGFNFGMRCPSEIISLNVEDIVINSDGTGYIRISEKKKRGRRRKIIPYNKNVLSSLAYKTPKNYLKNWRWKVANIKSGDAFFLQPNGDRVTDKYIRKILSPSGKKIVANGRFYPYMMRHTFATYFYQHTKDLKKVSRMLGHTKTVNTDKYVEVSEALDQQLKGKNLFSIALRPSNFKNMEGKQNEQETLSQPQKRYATQSNYSEKKGMGLAGFEPATSAV